MVFVFSGLRVGAKGIRLKLLVEGVSRFFERASKLVGFRLATFKTRQKGVPSKDDVEE